MDTINIPASQPEPQQIRPEKTPKKTNTKKELLSTLSILIIAPLIAVLLSVFVFQSYEVDGPSMEKTLQHKDRLIVTKTGKTWARIINQDYIPDRYSIIVFNFTGQNSYEVEKKQLIKRVIGLPGDKVVIKDGVVRIYNSSHPEGFYPDKEGPEASVISTTEGSLEQTVKAGEVFVLGDNRGNSLDSRAFGTVRADDIIGHLSARIYPFDAVKKF
jgi:signal peptidase I